MRKILLLTTVFFLLVGSTYAQSRRVTGKVTSAEDGSPLPGVNVIIKGTTIGTATDGEGNYAIDVASADAILSFSFIGLKSVDQPVGTLSTFDVQMETDATQLSEVIVTGYGEGQEKRMITGSVTSVKGETFKNLPVQTFDRALQGRAAGVNITSTTGQPGGALNVRIRGISSINAGNAPLYIVDGVQVSTTGTTGQGSSNPLASINPNDIQDIQILKDAASAAIYGAQSANGVVVITTKTGNKSGKAQVDFTIQEGIVQPFNLYEMMNGTEFANHWTESQINGGATPTFPWGDPSTTTVPDFDWLKNVFKDGRLKSYDLSVRGGDGKTSYLVSGSYNKQEGQVLNSDWERFTGRVNISTKAIDDKLTVNAKINVSHNRTWGTGADGNFINGPWIATFAALPTVPGRNDDGDLIPYSVGPFSYNIINYLEKEVRLGRTLGTVSSLSAGYKIIPGLTLSGLVGVDFSMNSDQNQRPSTIFGITPTASSSGVTNRRTLDLNSNVTLDYSLSFGANKANTIKALVGYEYKSNTAETNGFTKTNFSNPYFTKLISQGSAFSGTGASTWGEYKRMGYFGKVDYDYKEKYLASATVRRDASSRFGDVNPWGTFWAGSLGWRISEESFLDDVSFISDLKIKAGYGIVGNSNIGNFTTITKFGSAGGVYPSAAGPSATGLSITQLGNDAITWEKESIANIGVEFSLFNSRVYGSIEGWKKVNSDLLFSVPFLESSGVRTTTITQNVGEMQNKGVDIEVSGVIINAGDFKWVTSFNIGTLDNSVSKLYNGIDTLTFADGSPQLIVGRPASFLYVTKFAGVNPANGRGMVYDKNGNLSYEAADIDYGRYGGTPIPKAYGGWSNTFSFKGITLDVLFQYQFGNKVVNIDHQNFLSFYLGQVNQETRALDAWKQPGDVTSIPKSTTNAVLNGIDQAYYNNNFYYPSTWVSDAGFVRLKSITLSYDLPSSILSKAHLRSVRVFGMAYNLITWTKYDGIDPEVVAGVNSNSQGQAASIGNYPLGKQYSVGISVGL